MRVHALWHVAGVCVVVLYFLYCLSSIISTLLQDTSPYLLSEDEIAADVNETAKIPRIIHQVYLGFDNKAMPEHWQAAQKTCIDMHPDYEYILWSNETAYELLSKEYPWFLGTYNGYRYNVQRADSIRYFILARHGGIYIDLDNGCARHLDPLRSYSAWMPGTVKRLGLTNHIMGTIKGHPYFLMLINSLENYDHRWGLPYLTIMNSAGPHFVSMVWDEYLKKRPEPPAEVRILGWEGYDSAKSGWGFFTKVEGGTWHRWDIDLFDWASCHVALVGVVLFLGLCAGVSFMWYLGWSLALIVDSGIRSVRGGGGGGGGDASGSYAPLSLWPKAD